MLCCEVQWCSRHSEVGVVSGVQCSSGVAMKWVQCRGVVGASEVRWNS